MSKTSSVRLTRFELQVMEALWSLRQASVRELLEALPEARRPAYTTVQTIVRRLERKNALRQVRKIGNAYVYRPTLTREAAYSTLISDFLDLFGGSPRPLISHLVENGQLELEDLKEAESLLFSRN